MLSRAFCLGFFLIGSLTLLLYFAPLGVVAAQQENSSTGNKGQFPYKKTVDFDHFATGKIPEGFSPVLSGAGKEVTWEVRQEPGARSGTKVLAQTSIDEVNYRFPLLLYDELTAKNVEVAVQFKTISGKIDQAAGIVVRFQDEAHYYVVRVNTLEGDVRLFKMVDGERKPIAGKSVEVLPGEWYTLKLNVQDTHFEIFFNDQPLFEADDETYQKAGKIGLSTKSDAVAIFDDLQIASLDMR